MRTLSITREAFDAINRAGRNPLAHTVQADGLIAVEVSEETFARIDSARFDGETRSDCLLRIMALVKGFN